ncbi:dsRBD fold-containing protein [Nonomuraea sp. NPDC049607]|uniref:dsRBD fold-containing protein n=1 Tax=Nonomuraea sp. NPDC049607 TaxID=3154732 RepID=UPI00341D1357
MEAKEWTVRIRLAEDGDDTSARAVLTTPDGTTAEGAGHARRNPADPSMPVVGDELAVARALADLAGRLAGDARHELGDGGPVPTRSW